MSDIIIDIPSDIAMALKIPDNEAPSALRRELAIQLYAQHLLSFGKARQLARLSKWEFAELLGQRGIESHYNEQSLQEDMEFAYDNSYPIRTTRYRFDRISGHRRFIIEIQYLL